jgi:hypothetical protein
MCEVQHQPVGSVVQHVEQLLDCASREGKKRMKPVLGDDEAEVPDYLH